jgi:CRISPR-associated endonuclease/helicase Cas3
MSGSSGTAPIPDDDRVTYAHSRPDARRREWHTLRDHLEAVARLAGAIASKWQAGDWAHYAGLWHDLGKFSPAFQHMITADAEAERGKVNHSSAGALRAIDELGQVGYLLAFVIAGHHAGLPDLEHLQRRMREKEHLAAALSGGADADWLRMTKPLALPPEVALTPRNIELWVRFLFSALIDADRLDTERFLNEERTALRGHTASMFALSGKLDAHLEKLSANARKRRGATAVSEVRDAVLADCHQRSAETQGVFTLTVPTGGGKTLASLAFALQHAAHHRLDRVIVVIPYTSIIEQNAGVLKEILGEENVLEHHTNFDPGDQRKYWLDTENWDAPVIVTTSVQFFESLFANKTSVARKVHAIARAVVIFDEVQTLPPSLLKPIVDVMSELVARYGASLVLCTATQPALQQRRSFPEGFSGTREIVRDPRRHFTALQRVEAHWPADLHTPEPWPALAARIAAQPRALTIVHRRDDARALCLLLPPDTIHLSAAMCAQHRSNVLAGIRERLANGSPCRVVATQLVEAGVDLDFAVVFRALAGLDSLAQAAGRCNREGKLERGVLEIFVAETQPPPGELRRALDAGRIVASRHGGAPDLFGDPALYNEYFLQFYQTPDDPKRIQEHRTYYRFEQVAEDFQMIENGQESVVIPFDDTARTILARLQAGDSSARLLRRRLQRYTVAVPRRQMAAMRDAGVARELEEGNGIFVLDDVHRALYDDRFGLLPLAGFALDPEGLIV